MQGMQTEGSVVVARRIRMDYSVGNLLSSRVVELIFSRPLETLLDASVLPE